ncbi:MAG: hypothetical protein V1860_03935 [bacterium]
MVIKNNKGQGLLEAIAAIAIIIIGLVGTLALVHSSIASHYEARTRVIAANLAREAAEAVHNIRDDNWLAGNLWDDGLYDASDYEGIPILDFITGYWSINFTADNFSSDMTNIYQYTSGSYKNFFVQAAIKPADTIKTSFRRLVVLKSICYDGSAEIIEDSASCSTGEKIGVRIAVEVRWTEHERDHNLIVEDSVYNWR